MSVITVDYTYNDDPENERTKNVLWYVRRINVELE